MPGMPFGDEVAIWLSGSDPTNAEIFSSFQHRDHTEYIEPLSFILRSPLAACPGYGRREMLSKTWLVLASGGGRNKGKMRGTAVPRKSMLFDAGASTFRNGSGGASTGWFVDTYREQGIEFDAIYGWEATPMNATAYYEEVPEELLAKLFWSRRAAG